MNVRSSLRDLAGRFKDTPAAAEVAAASAFWDVKSAEPEAIYWTAQPQVREHVNRQITGVPWLWPTTALKAGWAYRPFQRGLSIGCGTGALERDLRFLGVCESMEAFDLSPHSITQARKEAKKERVKHLKYRVADCDRLQLPRDRYDAAFFHQSLHHISDPDRLLDQVARSLRGGRFLYVDDYVGPSRDEWNDSHLVHAREVFAKLPDEVKIRELNAPLDWADPSEMIRSSRIRPAIEERFELLHFKPYWGNILFPIFCASDGAKLLSPEYRGLVEELIEKEAQLASSGALGEPLFAVIVARGRESG